MKKHIYASILGATFATTCNLYASNPLSTHFQEKKIAYDQTSKEGMVVFSNKNGSTTVFFVMGHTSLTTVKGAAPDSLECLYVDVMAADSKISGHENELSNIKVKYAQLSEIREEHYESATFTLINKKRPVQCAPIIGMTDEDEVLRAYQVAHQSKKEE